MGSFQQPLILFFYDLIVLARAGFQLFVVCYRNVASSAMNRSRHMKFVRCYRHAFPTYSQHNPSLFMRYVKFIAREAVQAHQQKVGKLLIDGMISI